MDDFKKQLQEAYSADVSRREKSARQGTKWKDECRDLFVKILKQERKVSVLELGCGVGLDSAYIASQGLAVLATDMTSAMVESARQKGVRAQVLDLYDVNTLDEKFDAIYAMNVLLHVPLTDLDQVLANIHHQLKDGGVFFLGNYSKTQDTEATISDPEKISFPRFFSWLSEETIMSYISPYFTTIQILRTSEGFSQDFQFLGLFLRKK